MIKRGALIVFEGNYFKCNKQLYLTFTIIINTEGCDRSGKTTQCKKVFDFLKCKDDKSCHLMRFPGLLKIKFISK